MAMEIERKFLVTDDCYKNMSTERLCIRQGYLCREIERTVRVRTINDKGFLTVKGRTCGISRPEFEYEIPFDDAESMLAMCGKCLEKTRYIVPFEGNKWEVDEYRGALSPLVVAEIELPSEESTFEIPSFVGKEVSDDPGYFNSSLIARL